MIHIETPRLQLREWEAGDTDPFYSINSDPKVMEHFPSTLSMEESANLQKRIIEEMSEYGYGLYAVDWKETGQFIGFIGFHHATFPADFTPCIEIGWRLFPNAWGRGLATEGATACLNHGFSELGFTDVYSFTACTNEPSIRVMKRLNFAFEKTFQHPNIAASHRLSEHVLYSTNAKRWLGG
ncbi:acetyltransferase, GNAT family [Geomicrobium sp. JCM 19037]|uniref:GNAT family N-acetyltransferase n=1 Tax=Geomicrobium sp. JCM 19037 TaxID=1460634 RepID=UPI00045F2301|nr:GNAT family N-acetyltransferase [Geomicrobium sp. JCM 19037]GAK05838.1 acetyltransferase, GNAT family [Geomicrobium sp. JCM 19037]